MAGDPLNTVANVDVVAIKPADVLETSAMVAGVLETSGMVAGVLETTGMVAGVLETTGMVAGVLETTGMVAGVLETTGMVADVLETSAMVPAQELAPTEGLVPADVGLIEATVSVESAILTDANVLAEVEGLAEVTETLAAGTLVREVELIAESRAVAAAWNAGQAVTEIYRAHYNQLVRLALLLVHDVQTAEEVVQDAFVSMNDAWRRLHDADKALAYLRQTVVNKSRSVLRHRKVVDMHAPKPAPDEQSAEQAAMALLESDAVCAALRTLPERQREAIVLRYYVDLSEADIAKTMAISRGAVKSHTARAMAALKTIMQQEAS